MEKPAKVALITGASSGIGYATALLLAERGFSLALVARRSDNLQQLSDALVSKGGRAHYFCADVSSEEQVKLLVENVIKIFGTIDVLVNSAGIIRPGVIAEQPSQQWQETFDINVMAPMLMAQAVIPSMRQSGSGHIVNISSNAAKIPGGVGQASYAASKYAVTAMSSSLRKELATDGIKVTVIEPGTTATDIAQSIPDERARMGINEHVHKASSMQAIDIAEAVFYALSQPARVNVSEIWLTPTMG